MFIAIEKPGIGGCTTTTFQMLRPTGQISFAAGLQSVKPFFHILSVVSPLVFLLSYFDQV